MHARTGRGAQAGAARPVERRCAVDGAQGLCAATLRGDAGGAAQVVGALLGRLGG